MQLIMEWVSINDIQAKEYDIFIIPGGAIFQHLKNAKLLSLVQELHAKGKWIAGICAGTVLLHAADMLRNTKFSTSLISEVEHLVHLHEWEHKQSADVTVDGQIITAIGSAYVEFAAEILKQLHLFDDGEKEETLLYFKNKNERFNEILA